MAPWKTLLFLLLLAYFLSLTLSYQYVDDDGILPYSTIRLRRRLFAKRRHRNICDVENDEKNNEKLRETIRKTDYVFTGKVLSYSAEAESKRKGSNRRKESRKTDESNAITMKLHGEEDKSQTFQVEIKRVMKGGETLSGVKRILVKVPKEFVSGVEVTSDSAFNTNCIEFHPVLKVRQTAILLARRVADDLLELTSFPVAMTLRHLDRVDAAVTGIDLIHSIGRGRKTANCFGTTSG